LTDPVLIDTDVLSAIMRGNPAATARARAYLDEHGRIAFSIITRYEILRGLSAKNATKQIQSFETFCARSTVAPLDDAAVVRAADIYGDLSRRGQLIGDADILIAASALVNEMGLATNNRSHFERIRGLRIENWLE